MDSDFFLCSVLMTCWSHYSSFLHRALNLPSSFIYHTHDDFSYADPSSTQDTFYTLIKHTLYVTQPASNLQSSLVRASDQCAEGHRFNSCRGLRHFLCPMLVKCWSHHFSWKIIVMFGRLVTEDVKAWTM